MRTILIILLLITACRGKEPKTRYAEPTWKKCSAIGEANGMPCHNKAKANGLCLSHGK